MAYRVVLAVTVFGRSTALSAVRELLLLLTLLPRRPARPDRPVRLMITEEEFVDAEE